MPASSLGALCWQPRMPRIPSQCVCVRIPRGGALGGYEPPGACKWVGGAGAAPPPTLQAWCSPSSHACSHCPGRVLGCLRGICSASGPVSCAPATAPEPPLTSQGRCSVLPAGAATLGAPRMLGDECWGQDAGEGSRRVGGEKNENRQYRCKKRRAEYGGRVAAPVGGEGLAEERREGLVTVRELGWGTGAVLVCSQPAAHAHTGTAGGGGAGAPSYDSALSPGLLRGRAAAAPSRPR